MDCIFCDILQGRAESSIVHRDGLCTVFMDIQPVNPGHLLVIPNRHAASLAELAPDTGAEMFRVAQRMALTLRRAAGPAFRCEGVNVFLADGEAAMQEVFHVHLHVLPRYAGDGFGLKFAPGHPRSLARVELDRVAGAIRSALA